MQQGEGNALAKEWDQLHWWCLPVRLKNVRNARAREHPVFVMRSLPLYAQHGVPQELRCPWRFHFTHDPGSKVLKGAEYHLNWIFPMASQDQPIAYEKALRHYIGTDGGRNYHLLPAVPAQRMTLSSLRATQPLDATASSLCLHFKTPLCFSKNSRNHPEQISAEKLRDYIDDSILWGGCGLKLPKAPLVPDNLEIDCRFWKFRTFSHRPRSRSVGPPERLYGMLGPLYLRGAWQEWEPWLRLASVYGLGKRGALGQGAFSMITDQIPAQRAIEEGSSHSITPGATTLPLVIRAFAGHLAYHENCLIMRKGTLHNAGEILMQVPVAGLKEVQLHGHQNISSQLLEVCSREGILLRLCTVEGHPTLSLPPQG